MADTAPKKDIEGFEDLFNEENIPEGNWFKFEKPGDMVAGEVVEVSEKPSKIAGFPDQRVFLLKKKNGDLINVGLKKTSDYLMTRTSQVRPGDLLAVEFKKIIPATKAGMHDAHSIEVYVKKVAKQDTI